MKVFLRPLKVNEKTGHSLFVGLTAWSPARYGYLRTVQPEHRVVLTVVGKYITPDRLASATNL